MRSDLKPRGDGDWIVLRTQPRKTLLLARSLAEEGYEVWTPIDTKMVDVPRSSARHPAQLPLLPTYVFARSTHLLAMVALAAMEDKPRRGAGCRLPAHPDFSVMIGAGHVTFVPAQSLAGFQQRLQTIEDCRAGRQPRHHASKARPKGEAVKISTGAATGLTGHVRWSNHNATVIEMPNGIRLHLETFLLPEDEAYALTSREG